MVILLKFIEIFLWPWFLILPSTIAFKVVCLLSRGLGFFITISPFRKTVTRSLQLTYKLDNPTAKKLSKTFLYKMSRYIFEIISLRQLSAKNVHKLVSYKGLNHLDKALISKKGAILVILHAGNWEMTISSLAQYGYPVNAAIKDNGKDPVITFTSKNRTKNKVKLLNTERNDIFIKAIRALKRGEIFVIAADTGARESDRNLEVNILGGKALVATGWATMALKTKTPVFAFHAHTTGPLSKYQATINPPLYPEEYKNEQELIEAIMPIFEKYLLEHKTEWFLPLSEYETKRAFQTGT